MHVKVPGRELIRALGNAALFAGRKEPQRWLQAIWLEVGDGRLTVAASDRKIISVERVDTMPGMLRSGWFGLHHKDAQALTKQLPTDFTAVALSVRDDGMLHVTAGSLAQRFRPAADHFIAYRQLLSDHRCQAVSSIALAPKLVAKFAKVRPAEFSEAPHIELVFAGRTRPARVHIGEHFTALLAPITMTSYRIDQKPRSRSTAPDADGAP